MKTAQYYVTALLSESLLLDEQIKAGECLQQVLDKANAYDVRYGCREEIRLLQGQVRLQSDRIIQLENQLAVTRAIHSGEIG